MLLTTAIITRLFWNTVLGCHRESKRSDPMRVFKGLLRVFNPSNDIPLLQSDENVGTNSLISPQIIARSGNGCYIFLPPFLSRLEASPTRVVMAIGGYFHTFPQLQPRFSNLGYGIWHGCLITEFGHDRLWSQKNIIEAGSLSYRQVMANTELYIVIFSCILLILDTYYLLYLTLVSIVIT